MLPYSVAPEQRIPLGETVIDASLAEVLVGGLGHGEQILSDTSTEIPSIGQRKQCIQKGQNRRIHFDRAARQQSEPGISIGYGRNAGNTEAIDQRFKRAEKERPVAPDRAAQNSTELVSLERRNGLSRLVEEVLGVE